MFPITSRYYNIPTATVTTADGRTVAYLRRRFIPDTSNVVILVEHVVVEGDRLDNITARYLGDPEQFWQVCDVNFAMRPDELTEEVGRRLRIPFPRGG